MCIVAAQRSCGQASSCQKMKARTFRYNVFIVRFYFANAREFLLSNYPLNPYQLDLAPDSRRLHDGHKAPSFVTTHAQRSVGQPLDGRHS
jgi:hypothetical protein